MIPHNRPSRTRPVAAQSACTGSLAGSQPNVRRGDAPDAAGITSVLISQGSIRPDECAVRGPLYESAPHGVPYERSQMETGRESGTGRVRLAGHCIHRTVLGSPPPRPRAQRRYHSLTCRHATLHTSQNPRAPSGTLILTTTTFSRCPLIIGIFPFPFTLGLRFGLGLGLRFRRAET